MAMPFLGILLLVTVLLSFQGGVLVDQRRAQAAADLAALAGASAARSGEDACATAAAVAARNAARLSHCRLGGPGAQEVLVTVTRDGPSVLGREVTVHASARGGPAPS
jgi:secretion/DNA translocation related TadE-like protein